MTDINFTRASHIFTHARRCLMMTLVVQVLLYSVPALIYAFTKFDEP